MSDIYQLFELQQVENQIRGQKSQLNDVLEALQDRQALQLAEQNAHNLSSSLKSSQSGQKALEHELGTLNAKFKRSEQRLYSGKVSNPKELNDLQNEIKALSRRRTILEDDIFEIMLTVEETQTAFSKAETNLQEEQALWKGRQAELEQEKQALAIQVNTLLQERKLKLPRISPEALANYKATGRKRSGQAVAGLIRGRCQSCQVTVSATKKKAADEGSLVHCGSCGRILCPV